MNPFQPNPNFLPIPAPPFQVLQAQPPHPPLPENEPPARVQVALAFLNALTGKTMIRAAVNDIQIQWQPEVKLTHAELNAQATACNVLNDYLLGRLDADDWETQRAELVDRVHGNTPQGDGPGVILRCVACYPDGPVRSDCRLCHGTGQLLVFPTSGEGS